MNPSDRTIADICREFGVNEEWLRSGIGPMHYERSREDELRDFVEQILGPDGSDFQRALTAVLARLSVDEWAILEAKARELAEEMEKTDA